MRTIWTWLTCAPSGTWVLAAVIVLGLAASGCEVASSARRTAETTANNAETALVRLQMHLLQTREDCREVARDEAKMWLRAADRAEREAATVEHLAEASKLRLQAAAVYNATFDGLLTAELVRAIKDGDLDGLLARLQDLDCLGDYAPPGATS